MWQEQQKGISESSIALVLNYFNAATKHDPQWYKAWHSWANFNCEAVLFYKHNQQQNKVS